MRNPFDNVEEMAERLLRGVEAKRDPAGNFKRAMKAAAGEPVKYDGSHGTLMRLAALTGYPAAEVARRAFGLWLKMAEHVKDGGSVQFTHPNWKKPKTLKVIK